MCDEFVDQTNCVGVPNEVMVYWGRVYQAKLSSEVAMKEGRLRGYWSAVRANCRLLFTYNRQTHTFARKTYLQRFAILNMRFEQPELRSWKY